MHAHFPRLSGSLLWVVPRGVLVDAVGLPIDLMDVIGVFLDPVGVWRSW